MKKRQLWIIAIVCLLVLIAAACLYDKNEKATVGEIPDFSGSPYVVLNDNNPEFSQEDLTTEAYEFYSQLDMQNRCGYAMACIGTEIMPSEERGSIGQIKPSGWQTVKYDCVDGKYLYNRCHLIGYQLTGENANPQNLITGTRYLNVEGMLPFENMVADYVKETGNHVLYRVTPVFQSNELVARGVKMEAYSVEDEGEGICFYIYAYNNQPGITIDYATGESWQNADIAAATESTQSQTDYIVNTSSGKFHDPDCGNGQQTKEENKEYYTGTRQALLDAGYVPAGCCDP